MTDIALEMDHVSKKFRRGEMHDSLRDLIPGLARKLMGRGPSPEAAKREFWALKDVSFQVKKGEAFGIIGHNGAGKSTMLKHLSGIMKPTQGSIQVKGKLSALIEVSAGFHPDLTGRENIYLNGTILGMKRHEIKARFDEIVAFSGLEDFLDTPVKRYSSGMYARLGFSVAAHLEPDILIIDEVLSVGDHVFQRKGVEKMASVLRGGATVIFVSHNMRAVADLCSRSILLDHGSILMEGPTSEVIKGYLNRVGASGPNSGQKAYVSGATTYGPSGPEVRFESGARIELEVEFTAREDVDKVAVVLVIRDENHYDVFQTSSEVLGQAPFSLKAGETRKCRFALTLHLVSGTFHVEILLYRYDIQKTLDRRFPVTTFYVGAPSELRGVANLYPNIIMPD